MTTLLLELQRLGSTDAQATETEAANAWAGTTGLELKQAINSACSTEGLEIVHALNVAAGTTQAPEITAASLIS